MGCPRAGWSRTVTAAEWCAWSRLPRSGSRPGWFGASDGGCARTGSAGRVFTEQGATVAQPRGVVDGVGLSVAIGELRREKTFVHGLARRARTTWRTVWTSIRPCFRLRTPTRHGCEGVVILGVGEHVWHHVSNQPLKGDGARTS